MMLRGCCMLKHAFLFACVVLLVAAVPLPAGANSIANVNMYGYPLSLGPGGTGAAGVPGEAYTVTDPGISGLSDVMSRYGIISASSVSQPSTAGYGYFGPDMGGISLGVNFG